MRAPLSRSCPARYQAPTPTAAPDAPAAAPIRVAQNTPAPAPPGSRRQARRAAPGAGQVVPACDKPGGMGLSRVVEIDTTGGPAFGIEHFKQYDFLRDHEVVLTFDDGPWPDNTPAVLKALADNVHQGDVLRDRRACDLASRIDQDGGRRRHDGRQPHLVA